MFRRRSRAAAATAAGPVPPADSVQGEVIAPPRSGGASRLHGQFVSSPPRELDGRKVVARFVGVVSRVPRYLKLGWLLFQDPTVSGKGKAALGGGLAYAISPIDALPGFIPVIGQLDDLAVLLLAVRTALVSCPAEVADRHLREVGLSWETLERDLVTLRATTIWLARRGGALAVRASKAMLAMATSRLRTSLTSTLPGAVPGPVSTAGQP